MGQGNSSPMTSGPALTSSGHVYINRYPWCKFLSYIRTIFAIVTVFSKIFYMNFIKCWFIVVYSAGIDALLGITSAPMGIYLIIVAIPMTLLEFGRIIRFCCGFVLFWLKFCLFSSFRTNGPVCSVFGMVLGFDRWKRGLFYATIAVVCFIPSIATTYSRVAGCFIFISGVLYVAKCFQKKKISTYIVDPNVPPPTMSGTSSREAQGFWIVVQFLKLLNLNKLLFGNIFKLFCLNFPVFFRKTFSWFCFVFFFGNFTSCRLRLCLSWNYHWSET